MVKRGGGSPVGSRSRLRAAARSTVWPGTGGGDWRGGGGGYK